MNNKIEVILGTCLAYKDGFYKDAKANGLNTDFFDKLEHKKIFEAIENIPVNTDPIWPVLENNLNQDEIKEARELWKLSLNWKEQQGLLKEIGTLKPNESPYEEIEPAPIDVTQFKPITRTEIIKILDKTIKSDDENKLITFLGMLSAYTEDSQLNISFNAPSSTGKSFIPLETSRFFPKKDVIEISYCSPTAFFHDHGEFDKGLEGYKVDLSRKILIFLDQPHTQLLQHLRPVLSHDKKEILIKITDKGEKKGLRTKNIVLRGFPSVFFCTAGLRIDEQEATRFILLSPQTSQSKIYAAVQAKIRKESDKASYLRELSEDPLRKDLMERIRAIKQEGIKEIMIDCPEKIIEEFRENNKILKPRHQRDIGRIISLAKAFALVNLWFRKRHGDTIIANSEDVNEAFIIWGMIHESQELNIPPYIYSFYQEIITTAGKDKLAKGQVTGLTRKDIHEKHRAVYGRSLSDWTLKDQILKTLEYSGLITQESDPADKRKVLIYPTTSLNSSNPSQSGQYIERQGGVNHKGEA